MSEKKGATCQSFIRKEITTYRIGTLVLSSAQCAAGAPERMGTWRNGPGSQPNFDGISIFSHQLFILTQKISLGFQ